MVAIEFEDIEPLAERDRARGPLDDDLMELGEEARRTGKACFHTFHTYRNADA